MVDKYFQKKQCCEWCNKEIKEGETIYICYASNSVYCRCYVLDKTSQGLYVRKYPFFGKNKEHIDECKTITYQKVIE